MSKPRKLSQYSQPTYPTLARFVAVRGAIVRRLAVGALSMGVAGLASGCVDHQRPEADAAPADAIVQLEDEQSPPLPDVDTDTSEGELYEMMPPGGMPEPVLFSLRLPETGFLTQWLAYQDYLSFALTLSSEEAALVDYARSTPDAVLAVVAATLRETRCEQLDPAVGDVQEALRVALQAHFESVGLYGPLLAVGLEVEYCENRGEIDGDMPEPDLP